ncbi:DUF6106 family protein [Mediterraneibacter agrestimuris]|uniref:DUF6106 family protein n=1 Tax=Mediterraneibacter agrestimuris TaxID=2941333 RepID=UPI00203E657C|nr:DUF6106 family protein [Mediterraneibacter agrestimuris]
MNDAYYEQLVTRKSKPMDMVIRFLVIFVIIAVAFFGMPLIGFLAVFVAVLLGILAFYFVFPRLNVEYEYVILNHDMDVDAIYSQSKRKRQLSFDIQQAEIIAPSRSSRLNSYKPEKTYDFSSGNPDARTYSLMMPIDQKLTCIIFEPDEKMFQHIQGWMGSKLYRD